MPPHHGNPRAVVSSPCPPRLPLPSPRPLAAAVAALGVDVSSLHTPPFARRLPSRPGIHRSFCFYFYFFELKTCSVSERTLRNEPLGVDTAYGGPCPSCWGWWCLGGGRCSPASGRAFVLKRGRVTPRERCPLQTQTKKATESHLRLRQRGSAQAFPPQMRLTLPGEGRAPLPARRARRWTLSGAPATRTLQPPPL